MPRVTKVLRQQGKNRDRVFVYIDNNFCTSIRERTWIGMNISIGTSITCEELKKLENNFWKRIYGPNSWGSEKKRIQRIMAWFSKYLPEVKVAIVGFGANTNEYLENIHSCSKGEPDLSIRLSNSNIEIVALEVTGTERKKGHDYWIRADKIKYIQTHKERDI